MHEDDPAHPIPKVDALDVHAVRKSGGSDLIVVIATPLASNERSQRRLLLKIENYLGFINSAEYENKCGKPTPENSKIVVRIHAESDPAVFELLERCKPWAKDSCATLEVSEL